MRCVHAKAVVLKLRSEKIIPETVETQIKESKSADEAKDALFEHLRNQATLEGLRRFCSIMTESEGYQRMQRFGKDLQTRLMEVGSYS